jgi:hypothetical protein
MGAVAKFAGGAGGLALIAAGVHLSAAAYAPDLSRRSTKGAKAEGRQMNEIAPAYVKLALAMGLHDADYVDAVRELRRI